MTACWSFWLTNLTFTFMNTFFQNLELFSQICELYTQTFWFFLCYYREDAIIVSGGELQFMALPLMHFLLFVLFCFYQKYSNHKASQLNKVSLNNKCKKMPTVFFFFSFTIDAIDVTQVGSNLTLNILGNT